MLCDDSWKFTLLVFIKAFRDYKFNIMLSEFYGLPRPDKEFNLFYLEPQEVLISSVNVSLRSGEFDR